MIQLRYLPALLFLAGCLQVNCTAARRNKSSDAELATLVHWMSGDFSSQAQSQRDSDYYDIRLHLCPIWPADKNKHWLYVEQATASTPDKPYRQRIYQILPDGSGFKSVVYTLPEPDKWIGAYRNPGLFANLKPAELVLREGCTVFLQQQKDGSFAGATRGDGCESTLRGAKYARSQVTITEKMLESWDQGFNEKGEQVWGATKGGYQFVKQ